MPGRCPWPILPRIARQRKEQLRAAPIAGVGWARTIPLLLAKAIVPSVRLIQAAGQAPPPDLRARASRRHQAELTSGPPALASQVAWRRVTCNAIPPRNGRLPADGRSLRRRNCGPSPAVGQRGKEL